MAPAAKVKLAGLTLTEATAAAGLTPVNDSVAPVPSQESVTVVEPAPTYVTNPLLLTVTTPVLPDKNVTVRVAVRSTRCGPTIEGNRPLSTNHTN